MRYLQITMHELHDDDELYKLVWPNESVETAQFAGDDASLSTFIMRGEMHMIPATHPNIAFILLRVHNPKWYDDDTGPYKFIPYVRT